MNRITARLLLASTFGLSSLSLALGQVADSPMTRLRAIGSPSAVDRYRPRAEPASYQQSEIRESAYRNEDPRRGPYETQVRQTQFEVPQLPNTSPSSLPPPPITTTPRSLPINQGPVNSGVPLGSGLAPVPVAPAAPFAGQSGDYAPLTQPILSNQFSTIDNSCCVTGPSGYTAASAPNCCAPVSYEAPYLAPPGGVQQVVPGAVVPGVVVPAGPIGRAAGAPAGALISFGQEAYPVQVGQGLFGQPVAYVPGQKFRNWLRYIFP